MGVAGAVVIAAVRGVGPGESRLDLLSENARIAIVLGEQLAGCRGIIVVVSNPVDVLTYLIAHASGLPHHRVMGTGTMLETARLRQMLGRELKIEPRSIHANVIGEHGDSNVVLWSSARIGGNALRNWPDWRPAHEKNIATEVQRAAGEIIKRKGATNHAIGLVTAALLKWALRGERRVLTVSRVQTGLLGVDDVALSLPAVVSQAGAEVVLEPEMSTEEHDALLRSAEILKAARQALRL